MDFDVLIIGGGPAGATAGTVLQKKGYKTCIIDHQVFPREKLCGGVLTLKSRKLIQNVYGKDISQKLEMKYINKVNLYYKNSLIGKYEIKDGYGVVERKNFDACLVDVYQKCGGCLLDGQTSYHIDYGKNIIILKDSQEIYYKYLIGADGINSKVRSFVDKPWKSAALCFETFVPNTSEDTIKIYFGNVFGGYNWRIPGKNQVAIGLGELFFKGSKRTPRKYAQFFSRQGVTDIEGVKGAFLPIGNYVKKPVCNNVLLVGDAAGIINRLSGEGIYYAMESGRQAALAIQDTYEKNLPIENYIQRLSKIHKKIKKQKIYYFLLYTPIVQFCCMQFAKKHPAFVCKVLNKGTSSLSIWKNFRE